jgi:glycosyltransferase involved in cell wall biosynthesis
MNKKLLYIYYYCNLGGVASVIKQRYLYMKNLEYEFELIFYFDHGGIDEWKRLGIPVHVLSGYSKSDISNNSVLNPLEKKALSFIKNNPDYHAITIFDMPELYNKIKKVYSGKLIYEVHSPNPKILERNTIEKVKDIETVFVPSYFSKKMCYNEYNIKRNIIQVVPNIIDISLFNYNDKVPEYDKKIIGWVGKFSRYKNFQEALDIFKSISERRDDVMFLWGTGGGVDTKIQQTFFNILSDYNL